MKIYLSKKTLIVLVSSFLAMASAFAENNPIHAVHYEVLVVPDFSKKSIKGETVLEFESLKDELDRLSFPVHELKIQSVSIKGKPAQYSSVNGVLNISFNHLKRGQKSVIKVIYEGAPSSGIIFDENYLYTAYDTCFWMICDQDNPGDKATLQLTIDVPKDMTVIASGVETKQTTLSNNLSRHVWRQNRPYSAYLFGFAAGTFKFSHSKAGIIPLDFFSSSLEPSQLDLIFQDTGKIISFFEGKSGIKYPNARYMQLVVPGSEAQEVSSYSVLGSNHVEPLLTNPKEDWAAVHELAHQWWGNDITCASWDHFWLNEGLVVFMTAAYKESRWGKAEYDKEMEIAQKRYQIAKDAGFDVPLTKGQSLPNLKMRRAIVYSKGALFLDALRKQMGEAPFWKGLKEYSLKYSGKTVESKDFEMVMLSHGNSETAKLFQAWVF